MGLKEKRIESGMTQKEAADLFGLKFRTYQNYENGVTSPSMDTAAVFARYFSCTIGDLFNLQEGLPLEFTDDEKTLLDIYRSIPAENRRLFLAVASAFTENNYDER